MILSNESLLSDKQAITGGAGTIASTNYIDLGEAGTPHGAKGPLVRDIGKGGDVPFEAIVTTAFAGTGTVQAAIIVDNDVAFGSPKTVITTVAFAIADLVEGKNLFANLHLPEGIDERYMRVNYIKAGGTISAGNVTCGVSGGRQTNI
jgi:hypothetical protein